VDSAPSNEREARLRKRMMDRKQRQKARAAGPEGSDVAPRPAFSPSHRGVRPVSTVHQRAAKSSASQHKLYADRAAWGEHGLGLPGLAREHHNDKQRQLLEERQKIAAQRAREKEEKARKLREDKILAKQRKEEEEREQGLKLNYTFKPPPVPIGDNDGLDIDVEGDSTDVGEETTSDEEDSEDERGRKERAAAAGRGGRNIKATMMGLPPGAGGRREEQQLRQEHTQHRPQRRPESNSPIRGQRPRVFAAGGHRPQIVHAQSKPRRGNEHNLFKVYGDGGGPGGLPGHNGAASRSSRPATATGGEGMAGRGQSTGSGRLSGRRYNFLQGTWDD